MKKSNLKIYWKLFISNLMLSAFTFGGGFVIISLMKKKFVEQFRWVEEEEMLDLAAIAQSAPGALAVNASIIIGYRIKKFWGAIVSVIGTSIPPLIIISLISIFYNQFRYNEIVSIALLVMRAGVAAVLFDVIISLAQNIIKTRSIFYITLMIVTFIAAVFFGVSSINIIISCIIIGVIAVFLTEKKGANGR